MAKDSTPEKTPNDKPSQDLELQVHIKWDPDDDSEFPIVQHLWINFDSSNFYTRFYRMIPPVIPVILSQKKRTESEDNLQSLEVRGKLISTVTIPAQAMPAFIAAFLENAMKFEERTGKELDWSPLEERIQWFLSRKEGNESDG